MDALVNANTDSIRAAGNCLHGDAFLHTHAIGYAIADPAAYFYTYRNAAAHIDSNAFTHAYSTADLYSNTFQHADQDRFTNAGPAHAYTECHMDAGTRGDQGLLHQHAAGR